MQKQKNWDPLGGWGVLASGASGSANYIIRLYPYGMKPFIKFAVGFQVRMTLGDVPPTPKIKSWI